MALVKTKLRGNEIEYDDTEFEILKDEEDGISYLHYIGNGGAVRNPRGNTSCYKMFNKCKNIEVLDLSNFDTSNVTSMRSMFRDCWRLSELDVSHFDTSNVTNMGSMFRGCESLKELDVSHFDTSNVTIMGAMFYHCCHLTELNVSHFDTSNVTSMWAMFHYCYSLIKLDLSNFDTSSVTTMGYMFCYCWSLKELDLSHFKMTQVEYVGSMFKDCRSLISLNLSGFDSGFDSGNLDLIRMSKVDIVIGGMFDGCTSLSSLDLSNLPKLPKFYVIPMFQKCNNLENIVFKCLEDILSYSVGDLKIIFKDCSYLDKLLAEKSKRKVSTGSVSPATGYLINTSPSKSGCMYPLGEVGILGIASNPLDGSKLLENMIIDLLNQDEKAVLKKHRGMYGIKDPYFVSILSMVKPKSEMIYDYCDRVIIPNIKKLFQKTNGRSSLTVGDVFKKLSTTYGESLTAIALARFLSDEYLVD